MVFDKLKEIIADQLDADAESITMESSITDDLHADSLDVVDLITTQQNKKMFTRHKKSGDIDF